MKLTESLSEKKSDILQRWCDIIVATYPPDTAQFLKTQKDRFTNPVGRAIEEGAAALLEGVLSGTMGEEAVVRLDDLMRIRAVQEFSPSGAVSFILDLKALLREAAGEADKGEGDFGDELAGIYGAIDRLLLAAFDRYMASRETLFEVKCNELRRMTFRLIERADRIIESGELTDEDREALKIVKRKEVTK